MDKHITIQSIATSTGNNYSPRQPETQGFKEALHHSMEIKKSGRQLSHSPVTQSTSQESVFIGTLSQENPTVSELLLQSPEFKDKAWDIIFSAANRHKGYTRVPLGASLYYNSDKGELHWSHPAVRDNPIQLETPSTTERMSENGNTLYLGRLSSELPTISHLLEATPELSVEKWNILANPSNRLKNFERIPLNAQIHLDTTTKEIHWTSPNTPGTSLEVAGKSSEAIEVASQAAPAVSGQSPLPIGTISNRHPTVSHLLSAHPDFSGETWRVLADSVNQKKPFDTIRPGTQVFINPETKEISWYRLEVPPAKPYPGVAPYPPAEGVTLAPDLTEAVQPFMGKPYDEIDCYDLLIRGLRKMGIPYMGKDGLRNTLTRMARENGLPANAYLNGEGIVKAAGKQVFTDSYMQVTNWKKEAGIMFSRMQSHLQKGQILSFSTQSRGHTGIISQRNGQWTFINSGRMDNHINQATSPQEVGEEKLLKEVENWFKVANMKNESLMVTLGQLEDEKIRTAFMGPTISQRM